MNNQNITLDMSGLNFTFSSLVASCPPILQRKCPDINTQSQEVSQALYDAAQWNTGWRVVIARILGSLRALLQKQVIVFSTYTRNR